MYDNQVDEAKENINFLMESCRFTTTKMRAELDSSTVLEQIWNPI